MKKEKLTIEFDIHDVYDKDILKSEIALWDAQYLSVTNMMKILENANIRNLV